jgi:hypothetical protein
VLAVVASFAMTMVVQMEFVLEKQTELEVPPCWL